MKKSFVAKSIEKLAVSSAEKSVNKCAIIIMEEPKIPKLLLKKKH